jgi:hypothetical protein
MSCVIAEKRNLAISRCPDLPEQFKGMLTVPEDFVLSTANAATVALLKTALQTALKAGLANRIYFWPLFKNMDNNSEEAVYEDTPYSINAVRDGQYRFKPYFKESLCVYKKMFSHNATSGRVIFFDSKGNLFMTEVEGGYSGFTMAMLNVEKLQLNDGTVSTKIPVYIALEDPTEVSVGGVLIAGTTVRQLIRLKDVTLTIVGSPSATTIVVDVKTSCDNLPVNGLVVADFKLLTTLGATQVITSLVEVDGRYTLTDTDFATGTLDLVLPEDLSIDAYENEAPVVVTVA